MNAKDFEYDGEYLRDYGMIICCIDSSPGVQTVSAGSKLNWNQVPMKNGAIHMSTAATYDNVLETTFQICKYNCSTGGIDPIGFYEQRKLFRWLNREEPHVLRLIGDDDPSYDYVSFEGSFNIDKIEINGQVFGYELNFVSNRPFAIGELVKKELVFTSDKLTQTFEDWSDKIGYIYPKLTTIKCTAKTSLLKIHNSQDVDDRFTEIKDCENGNIFTFDEFHNITSSPDYEDNPIQDRFNFVFFRVSNSYTDNKNTITVSSPCVISFEYYPIIKGVAL